MSERNERRLGLSGNRETAVKPCQLQGQTKKRSCYSLWGGESPTWFPGLARLPRMRSERWPTRSRLRKVYSQVRWVGCGAVPRCTEGGGQLREGFRKWGQEAAFAENPQRGDGWTLRQGGPGSPRNQMRKQTVREASRPTQAHLSTDS